MNQRKVTFVICLLFGYLATDIHGSDYFNDDNAADDYEYEYDDATSKSASKEVNVNTAKTPKPPSVPHFEQTELELQAKLGDNVILNCGITTSPNAAVDGVVMWYKNTTLITTGEFAINNRVELLQNKSILIQNLESTDFGDYFCKVLPGDMSLHIALTLNDELVILCDGKDVTNRSILFRQGESHVIECRANVANGTNIKWSFNGQRAGNLVSQVVDGKMYFDVIDEEHGGIYQCLGDDGSSQPQHGMVTVEVLYSPKVSTHRHRVNTEAGAETAELYCDYKAHPEGIVHWLRNNGRLTNSNKYFINDTMHNKRNRTILVIRDINSDDLGEYGCEVENSMGSNKMSIHLIFEPELPQFEDIKIDGNKVTLHWLVRSVQPLSEAVLDYKMTGSYSWSTVSVIHTQRHAVNRDIWKVTHEMTLVPGVWHTRIKTKNTVGWSKFSEQYDFTIAENAGDANAADDQLPPDDMVMVAGIGASKPKDNASGHLEALRGMLLVPLLLMPLLPRGYLI